MMLTMMMTMKLSRWAKSYFWRCLRLWKCLSRRLIQNCLWIEILQSLSKKYRRKRLWGRMQENQGYCWTFWAHYSFDSLSTRSASYPPLCFSNCYRMQTFHCWSWSQNLSNRRHYLSLMMDAPTITSALPHFRERQLLLLFSSHREETSWLTQ